MTEASNVYRSTPLPLDGRSIRLLHILPPSEDEGHDTSSIRGAMSVIDLHNQESFTALSYVWSQEPNRYSTAPSIILCDSVAVPITPNCHCALLHLRHKLGQFSIWIDAVCINQADKEEKSFQIPLLGKIYALAKEVYIWLGEGNVGTDRAIRYLDTAGFLEYFTKQDNKLNLPVSRLQMWKATWLAFTSFYRASSNPFPYLSKDGNDRTHPNVWYRSKRSPIPYATYYDLNALLTREWIKRIWTYQEVMLAKNPVVVCGHLHITWSRLAWSILFLDHIKPKRLGNLGIPLSSTLRTWKKIILTRERLFEQVIPPLRPKNDEHLHESEEQGNILTLCDIRNYREFLYVVFSWTLILCRLTVAIAWLSTANCASAIIVTIYMRSDHSSRQNLLFALYIYASVSSVAFILIFTGYSALAYSYYYKTLFNMPTHREWLKSVEDDEVDNFIDAIITRKSTDPKDMAFGLRAVLSIKLGKELPPPDYSSSLGNIYTDLTRTLLKTADQLDFLLPAAENYMTGQPSWIPNYSAEFSTYWLQPFVSKTVFTFVIDKSSPVQENAVVKPKPGSERCQKHFEYDRPLPSPHLRRLTIQAHHFCTVVHTFTLQSTSPVYTSSEDHIHLRNLDIMRTLCSRQNRVIEIHFFSNRLNYPGLSDDATLNVDHLRMYVLYLHMSRISSTKNTFKHMTSGNGYLCPIPYGLGLPLWKSMTSEQMLSTHIKIVNELVRTHRQFFTGRSQLLERTQWQVFGIGTKEITVGDKVVLVPGLPSLLALRGNKEECKLVSPAVVFKDVDEEMQERIGNGSISSASKKMKDVLEQFQVV